MERLLIQKLDTIKNGYNVSLGGLHQPKIETRSIYQFDTHGNFISEYNSITEAAKKYDIPDSNINNVCSGKNKYAGKYIWRYKEDVHNIETFKNSIDISMYDNLEPVYQFDLNQCFIREYQSAIDAAHANPNCFESSILDNCRGKYKYANGYIWKFKKDVPDINEFKNKIIDFTPNYFKGHPVLQYDLDGTFIKEYSSAQVASKELDCDTHTITFACSGRTKTGKGYIWRYKDDYQGEDLPKINYKPPKRPVIQLTLDKKYVARFDTITDASKQTGCSVSCIRDTCRGRQKSSGGYKWIYEEDYINNYILIDKAM